MNRYDQLRAQLEGGRVKRCHTVDYIGHYDNAQHSFNMLLIYCALHPNPQRDTMRAIMYHDLAERYTGDLPAPSLLEFPDLRDGIKGVEAHCRAAMGVSFELSPNEQNWVNCIDKIEHWLWANRQLLMGNTLVEAHVRKLDEILGNLPMPNELRDFMLHFRHEQGDDGIPS